MDIIQFLEGLANTINDIPKTICKHFDPSVDAESRYYKKYDFLTSTSLGSKRVYGLNATMTKQLSDYAASKTQKFYPYIKEMSQNRSTITQPIVNSSCIGESPGKELDQCEFNGYLSADELCNPCEVKEFKEQCEYLCVRTAGTSFGPFKLM